MIRISELWNVFRIRKLYFRHPTGMSRKAMTATWKIEECCTERAQSLFVTVVLASLRFCRQASLLDNSRAIDDRNSDGSFHVDLDLRQYGHTASMGFGMGLYGPKRINAAGNSRRGSRNFCDKRHYHTLRPSIFAQSYPRISGLVIDIISVSQRLQSSPRLRTQQLTPYLELMSFEYVTRSYSVLDWIEARQNRHLRFQNLFHVFWNSFYNSEIYFTKGHSFWNAIFIFWISSNDSEIS